jgi:hypothetical protein
MIIRGDGNVGIGTTAPGAKLEVHGPTWFGINNWDTQTATPVQVLRLYSNGISGVAPYSAFDFNTVAGYNSTNKLEINSWDYINGATAALFTLQGNGNVGIGTTDPQAALQVNGSGSTGSIIVSSVNGYASNYYAKLTSAYNNQPLALSNGLTGNVLTADAYGQTTTLYAAGSAAMTILNSGNVGIGTTTPGSLLDVHGPAQIGINNLDTQVSSPVQVLRLYANGISGVAPYSAFNFNTVAGWNSTNKLEINSWDYINGGTSALFTLQGNGNVGIGTTGPSYPLDVLSSSTGTTVVSQFRNTGNLGAAQLMLGNTTSGPLGDNLLLGYNGGNLTSGAYGSSYGDAYIVNTLTTGGYPNGFFGALIFGTNNQQRMQISPTGNVNIGTLGTGTVYSNGGTLTNTNPSDENMKTNITPINYGLAQVMQLNPVNFNWINDPTNEGLQFGFIAQQVQTVMPDATKPLNDGTGHIGLATDAILAATVNAVKELNLNLDGIAGTITPLTGSPADTFVKDFFNNLETKIGGWLADATNGISNIFAKEVDTSNLCVYDSTGAKTCISKSQLDALLTNIPASDINVGNGSSNVGSSASNTSGTTATSTTDTTTGTITGAGDTTTTTDGDTSTATSTAQ